MSIHVSREWRKEKETHTRHFVNLDLVYLLAAPRVAFYLLCVLLPFGQKPDLGWSADVAEHEAAEESNQRPEKGLCR